jgi:hypothetical protein
MPARKALFKSQTTKRDSTAQEQQDENSYEKRGKKSYEKREKKPTYFGRLVGILIDDW